MKIEVLKESDKNLLYSFYNTHKKEDSRSIDRFFKEEFKASEFIIYKNSDVILCALRVVDDVFYFNGYNVEVNIITDALFSNNCTPEKKSYFLKQVMNSFKYIKLFTLCPSELIEDVSFEEVFQKKEYVINRSDLYNIDGYTIEHLESASDLYDVYLKFTQRFNSYLIKTEESFIKTLEYYKANNYEMYVSKDDDLNTMGYIIYKYENGKTKVVNMMYLDTISLLALLNQAMGMNDYIYVNVSKAESFKKVLGELEYKLYNHYGIIINDEDLFQRLYNVKVTSIMKFIKESKRPYYLGVYK